MSTGDKLGDGASGFGFLVIGLTFLAVSCNLEDNVDMAISCIEWSCKAVLETPSLKLEPVLALACRGVVDGASILIIAWIWTSELDDKDTFKMQYQTLLPPQSELQLLSRKACRILRLIGIQIQGDLSPDTPHV